jgi:hypothetical protein
MHHLTAWLVGQRSENVVTFHVVDSTAIRVESIGDDSLIKSCAYSEAARNPISNGFGRAAYLKRGIQLIGVGSRCVR